MFRTCSALAVVALLGACANQAVKVPANTIQTTGPNPDAPVAVNQFGQLVGQWTCAGENRAQDGTWNPTPAPARWDWYWVLDGYGVQDVWQPGTSAPNAPLRVGTNVRLYDAKAQRWNIIWGTAAQSFWENITATWQDDERMVMSMERAKGPVFNAHAVRITFFNITDDKFDWTYEFAPPGTQVDAEGWTVTSKLFCSRLDV